MPSWVSVENNTDLAGQDKEDKEETLGTVISPDGLIVAALGGLDKSSIVNGQYDALPGRPPRCGHRQIAEQAKNAQSTAPAEEATEKSASE